MQCVRRSAALFAVLVGEVVAVLAVHRLGSRAPFDLPLDRLQPWLDAAPEDALVAAMRVLALGCAWWLLLATVAYAGASVARVPGAVRACEWVTPRLVRRVVDRSIAASLVVGAFAPFGVARAAATISTPAPTAPHHVIVDVRSGKRVTSLPAETRVSGVVTTPAIPNVSAEPSPTSVVVAPGDNLWDLSAAELARATGRDRAGITDREIAAYWRIVCDANRDTVRSADVNLIYPGEVIALPPVT
jgi:hypothetical protein